MGEGSVSSGARETGGSQISSNPTCIPPGRLPEQPRARLPRGPAQGQAGQREGGDGPRRGTPSRRHRRRLGPPRSLLPRGSRGRGWRSWAGRARAGAARRAPLPPSSPPTPPTTPSGPPTPTPLALQRAPFASAGGRDPPPTLLSRSWRGGLRQASEEALESGLAGREPCGPPRTPSGSSAPNSAPPAPFPRPQRQAAEVGGGR